MERHTWSYKMVKTWSLDLGIQPPPSSNPQIRAVATIDDRLILGTKASEIYEIDLLTTDKLISPMSGALR